MPGSIEVKLITKSFGKVTALKNVSFSSAPGMNIILGPNGAGKSTFLRCIDGLYKPDSGSIKILGKDPYRNSSIKNKVSLLTDNYALYDFLTVRANLIFFGRLYGLSDRKTLERAKDTLRKLDALEYLDRKVNELSRGTKQKIAFARALLNNPDVLLLDEPTAFLDAHSAEMMRKILLEYERDGKTILFVTQKLDEVTRFNGKVSIIRAGRLVREIRVGGLYDMVLKKVTVNIRFAQPLKSKLIENIKGFVEANSQNATFVKFKASGYKDINRIIKSLIAAGGSIVSVDYIEHLIDDLSR